jgi:hypothetical protein
MKKHDRVRALAVLGIIAATAIGVRADPLELEFKTQLHVVRVVPTGPGEMASIGSYSIIVYSPDGVYFVAGVVRERDGEVSKVWVEPDDHKGLRIWIWTTAAGTGAHGRIELMSFAGRALQEIKLPDADPKLLDGHMGHDRFDVVDGTVYWEFPLYGPNDPNSRPTRGTRRLVLSPDRKRWATVGGPAGSR